MSGTSEAYTLTSAISESLPNIRLLPQENVQTLKWSDLVNAKTEVWPIQYLLPGGAYIH